MTRAEIATIVLAFAVIAGSFAYSMINAGVFR